MGGGDAGRYLTFRKLVVAFLQLLLQQLLAAATFVRGAIGVGRVGRSFVR